MKIGIERRDDMKKIVIILILLLLIASPACAMLEREMEMSFDGKIDYVSQTGCDIAETVVVVKGEGSGRVAQMAEVTNEKLDHAASVYVESGGTWGIEAITGVKLNGNHYVQRVAPNIGQAGHLDQFVTAELNTFTALIFDGYAKVTGGVYQRHVDLANEGITLKEVLKIVGKGEGKDKIRFVPDEE
jgi:hypothetical protein